MGCPWQRGTLWGVAALTITSDIPVARTVSQGHQDVISGMKAENTRMSEVIKNIQEAQVCVDHCGSECHLPHTQFRDLSLTVLFPRQWLLPSIFRRRKV